MCLLHKLADDLYSFGDCESLLLYVNKVNMSTLPDTSMRIVLFTENLKIIVTQSKL
jgi:hypothetical protein